MSEKTQNQKYNLRNTLKNSSLASKWTTIALVVLIVGIGGLLLALQRQDTQVSQDPVRSEPMLAAAITLVEGNVQFSKDGTNWQDVKGGETIVQANKVRTLDNSRTVLLFDDGSALRLDANSLVTLSDIDELQTTVLLEEGQVYSRVIKSLNRTYTITTDQERFESLGTAFKTTATEDKDSLEVYESSVKVESQDITIEEGNTYDTESKKAVALDLDAVEKDEFVQWNKEKDSQDEKFKDSLGVLEKQEEPKEEEAPEQKPEPAQPSPKANISLSGSAVDSGIKLNWQLNNASSSDGYKIVRAKNDSTPTFGKDTSYYISNPATKGYVLDIKDGQTYYFRLCIYRASSSSCDTYSNSVKITAPNKPVEKVSAGAVSLNIAGSTASWSFAGTAPHGFKVLLNSSGNPTYPANSIQYVGPGTTSVELPAKSAGAYYVRICKYTANSEVNGGCTDYSNQVEYTVSE